MIQHLKKSTIKLLSISLCILCIIGCSKQKKIEEEQPETSTVVTTTAPVKEVIPDTVLSFVAVGDNLIHGAVYWDAKTGNDSYDFTPMYQYIKPYIEEADVSFINQETIIGGKEIGLSHYPLFNSPEELIAAISDTGFDLVNMASNHTLDKGEKGILNALSFFDEYDNLVTAGANRSFEEQQTLRTLKREDLTIGFLAYTSSTNGIPLPQGKEYLVNTINKESLIEDVTNARKNCDILLVSMHFGTEDSHKVNDYQREYSKLLNELGVDVIIGTHPHVIQPMEILENEEGHQTLVMYSLGNFLSAQIQVDEILEGMGMWKMRYNHETKEITFEDIAFMPLVDHYENGYHDFRVYPLKDYSEELANRHPLNFTKQYLIDRTKEIMGDEFTIILE